MDSKNEYEQINNLEKKKAILFLHGFAQNSNLFQDHITNILKSFKLTFPNHEILIPDAPHILNLEVKKIFHEGFKYK